MSWEIEPNPACQEETVTIDVTFTNKADYQMELTWLGIHFDWQLDNYYYTALDDDDDSIMLASGQSTTLDLSIKINKDDVDVGKHPYHWEVQYSLQDWLGFWIDHSDETDTNTNFRVEERDRDGDGHADSEDAFPDDPDEWVDTDLDGVGDNRDDFPNNPNKWEEDDDNGGDSPGFGVVIMLSAVFVALIFNLRGRDRRK